MSKPLAKQYFLPKKRISPHYCQYSDTKYDKMAERYSKNVFTHHPIKQKTSKEAFYRGCIHLTVFIILNIIVVILVIMEGAYTVGEPIINI